MDQLKSQLEDLVDLHGARLVTEALVEVFHDKADHVMSNWQDKHISLDWSRIASRIGNVVHWRNLKWPS